MLSKPASPQHRTNANEIADYVRQIVIRDLAEML